MELRFTTFTVCMYIIAWPTGCLAHSVSLLHEAPEGQRSPETLLLTGWSNASSLHNWQADGFCRCIHLDSCACIQNIDTLERVAGLEGDDLIEAHGTFYTSHCVSFCCRKEYNLDWMKGVLSHSRFAQMNYYCGVLISSLCLSRKNLLWWNSQMWQVWQFSQTRWVGLCLSISSFNLVLLSICFAFHIHYRDISQTSFLPVCCWCAYVFILNLDIVFFGENLPVRFFTSMKMVSTELCFSSVQAYWKCQTAPLLQ